MVYKRGVQTRRSPARRRRSNARQNVWMRSDTRHLASQWASLSFNLLPEAAALGGAVGLDPGARVGATVVRTRLSLVFEEGAKTSGTDGFYFGLAVSEKEEGSPITPRIDPFNDANTVDWMYWRRATIQDQDVGYATFGPAGSETSFLSLQADVKSQRKIISLGETLNFYMIVDSGLISQNAGVTSSVLLKLS